MDADFHVTSEVHVTTTCIKTYVPWCITLKTCHCAVGDCVDLVFLLPDVLTIFNKMAISKFIPDGLRRKRAWERG